MRTVKQVAEAAGVSVKTLHHYDAMGLLNPSLTGENGYRYYGKSELLRLQQILFYKELGLPLGEIGAILDDPEFDTLDALRAHRAQLEQKIGHFHDLIQTIDRTIENLEKDEDMEDKDFYAGISPETQERWQREAVEFWGEDAVARANAKARSFGPDKIAQIKREMEEIRTDFARLFDEGARADSDEVQELTARHSAWVSHSWTPDAESFKGLGRLYAENPEFRATYLDEEKPGCPDFIAQAMAVYADRGLRSGNSSEESP